MAPPRRRFTMIKGGSPAHGPGFWDAAQYHRFAAERSRAFFDLLARVPCGDVSRVADLGCGAGELTRTLIERWPGAVVWGVDLSPDMLAAAAAAAAHPNLRFVQADLSTWRPEHPLDRIICNAALQWVEGHGPLLERLARLLAPCGTLAVQMPNNSSSPAHRLLAGLASSEPWASSLGAGVWRPSVEAPQWYERRLRSAGLEVDLWETVYYHRLGGPGDVLEWMKGTALRPVLARLAARRRSEFLRVYGQALRRAYPEAPDGTIFPFRRMFFVARRG